MNQCHAGRLRRKINKIRFQTRILPRKYQANYNNINAFLPNDGTLNVIVFYNLLLSRKQTAT